MQPCGLAQILYTGTVAGSNPAVPTISFPAVPLRDPKKAANESGIGFSGSGTGVPPVRFRNAVSSRLNNARAGRPCHYQREPNRVSGLKGWRILHDQWL
jgi:hypothetical protein